MLLAADEPGGHHAATLLHRGRDLRAVEAGLEEDGPDTATLSLVAVASGAIALEGRLAAIDVATGDCDARGHRRLEDLGLCERERPGRDSATDQDRSPPAAHQNPNRTVVKYQRLDVSQSTASIDARVRPAVGSAQPGSERSRTISTFAAKTP